MVTVLNSYARQRLILSQEKSLVNVIPRQGIKQADLTTHLSQIKKEKKKSHPLFYHQIHMRIHDWCHESGLHDHMKRAVHATQCVCVCEVSTLRAWICSLTGFLVTPKKLEVYTDVCTELMMMKLMLRGPSSTQEVSFRFKRAFILLGSLNMFAPAVF